MIKIEFSESNKHQADVVSYQKYYSKVLGCEKDYVRVISFIVYNNKKDEYLITGQNKTFKDFDAACEFAQTLEEPKIPSAQKRRDFFKTIPKFKKIK